jgi:hypothetical protein
MNKLLLHVLTGLILLPNLLIAQEDLKSFDLKLYYNYTFSVVEEDRTDLFYSSNSTLKSYLFGDLSAAIRIYKDRSMQEIELSKLGFGKTDYLLWQTMLQTNHQLIVDGYKNYFFNLSLKYSYIVKLMGKGKNFGVFIGASAEPRILHNAFKPKVSAYYNTNQTVFGSKIYLMPGVQVSTGKRFYLELNLPVELIDLYWNRQYVENPALAKELRTTHSFESDFFNSVFYCRFGIGFRL